MEEFNSDLLKVGASNLLIWQEAFCCATDLALFVEYGTCKYNLSSSICSPYFLCLCNESEENQTEATPDRLLRLVRIVLREVPFTKTMTEIVIAVLDKSSVTVIPFFRR